VERIDYETPQRRPRRAVKPIDFGIVILGLLVILSLQSWMGETERPWWQQGLVVSVAIFAMLSVRRIIHPKSWCPFCELHNFPRGRFRG
jgi:hypothetical protein